MSELGQRVNVIVVFINYGALYAAILKPIPDKYRYESFAEGHLPKGAFWLSADARDQVEEQLRAQGLAPGHYITPATVHDVSKAKRHQGIIWPIELVELTGFANPNKPLPSRAECETLKQKLLEVISA